ncbi:Uncharacterised protein [Bordetella pertussis]|nr:Uncharacterised protein [Bordetella pertussis]
MNRSRIVTKLPVNNTASARQGWRLSTLGEGIASIILINICTIVFIV